MKLKNIFTTALSAGWLCCGAAAVLVTLAACSDDDPIGSLSNITVDQTYLVIPENGGDATLTINATADWAFDKVNTVNKESVELPAWLTASSLAGSAGETKVTFHADATTGGRETELRITVGDYKQFIKVRQGSLEAAAATCADVMTGAEGKNYRVTGRVTKIAGYEYGNWYLDDGTYDFASTAKNQDGLYIYGTLDKNGKAGKVNPIDGADGWGFEVGDVITVEGPLSIYGGTTYELVNVTVVSIVKSLLSVVSSEPTVEPDGGQIEVKVAYKGSGAYYTLADDAKGWISYEGVSYKGGTKTIFEQNPADTAIYKFNIAPNTGDKRTGAITFSSSSGKNSSQVAYTVTQAAKVLPHGMNPADPFTVAEAFAYIDAGGTDEVFVEGIISKIVYTFSAQYGTATFWISEDGVFNDDLTKDFEAYSVYYFGNKSWVEGNTQVAVGDKVVLQGKLTKYTKNDTSTYETSSKKAWIYSLNGQKE